MSARAALAMAAAAAAGIQVGATIVATRFVIAQTDPASLALLRYAIGFCCVMPLAMTARRWRIEWRDLVPVMLLGITQFGILMVLLNYGLRFISSAHASMIFSTLPLLTMFFAAGLGRESLTVRKVVGVLLTIVGVAVTLGAELGRTEASDGEWIGAAAVFAAAISGAVCSVAYRPYSRKYPALPLSAHAMFASVLFLAVLAADEGFYTHWPRFTGDGWAAVAFLGISSGIAFFLWLWALTNISPTRVTVFLALGPVSAAALGAIFLGEALTAYTLAGLACVVFGLWWALRPGHGEIVGPG